MKEHLHDSSPNQRRAGHEVGFEESTGTTATGYTNGSSTFENMYNKMGGPIPRSFLTSANCLISIKRY